MTKPSLHDHRVIDLALRTADLETQNEDHPVQKFQEHFNTHYFGMGKVRTLKPRDASLLSCDDHHAMGRMHSRMALLLDMQGRRDEGQSHLAAAMYHSGEARKKKESGMIQHSRDSEGRTPEVNTVKPSPFLRGQKSFKQVVDKLGRKRCFQNGKPVHCRKGGEADEENSRHGRDRTTLGDFSPNIGDDSLGLDLVEETLDVLSSMPEKELKLLHQRVGADPSLTASQVTMEVVMTYLESLDPEIRNVKSLTANPVRLKYQKMLMRTKSRKLTPEEAVADANSYWSSQPKGDTGRVTHIRSDSRLERIGRRHAREGKPKKHPEDPYGEYDLGYDIGSDAAGYVYDHEED